MYRRVLVPLDGSPLAEQVLPYVRVLGGAIQPVAHLLRVHPPRGPADPVSQGDREQGPPTPGAREQVEAYLESVKRDLQGMPMAVSVMVREGNAAELIIEEADREPGTLIAMATHGRSGLSRWALGSVSDKVLRATVSPLLLVRAGEPLKDAAARTLVRTLVVPLDGSREAEKILLPVISLSASMKPEEVVLVHALIDPIRRERNTEQERQAETEALGYLERVRERLSPHGELAVRTEVRRGYPADVIADAARSVPDPLIAMTTHGRSGVARWALGSVPDRVIRTTNLPVLVVKPAAEQRLGG